MDSCLHVSDYVEKRLIAPSTVTVHEWFTGWQPAAGVDSVRAVWKVQTLDGVGATFTTQLCIQTANVRPDNPNAPTLIDSSKAGSGEFNTNGSVSVSGSTGSALWFRIGVAFSSSGALMSADVGVQVSWAQQAMLVCSTRIELNANDTGNRIAVISPWVPLIYVQKVKFAWVGNGVSGGNQLQFRLCTQVAATSIEAPAVWNAFEAGYHAYSANTEGCTSDLAASTTEMWIRFGIIYNLASGTSQTTAALHAMVWTRF